MADTKRNSVAGKVATPKVGAQGMVEIDAALSKAVGARVKIAIASPSYTLEGTIFTVDSILNLIAINTAPPPPNPNSNAMNQPGDYHVLPFSAISSYELLSLPTDADRLEGSGPGFEGALPSVEKIDVADLRKREADAIAAVKAKELLKGKGVTKEAQAIFDDFTRTFPTRWHDKSIIVNDTVRIDPPYTVDSTAGSPDTKAEAVSHIKKVLTNVREKVQKEQKDKVKGGVQGGGRPGVATPTMPPRKGG